MKRRDTIGLFKLCVLLAALSIVWLIGLSGYGWAQGPIEIGYIMPLTGPEAPTGDISLKGA